MKCSSEVKFIEEREFSSGILSKYGAQFKLMVSGNIRAKEIKYLIRKLQQDLETFK